MASEMVWGRCGAEHVILKADPETLSSLNKMDELVRVLAFCAMGISGGASRPPSQRRRT